MGFHPRLSVNSICSWSLSLEEDLALWAELGVDHVGLISPKFDGPGWDAGTALVLDAGVKVSSMSSYRNGAEQALGLTKAVGSDLLYFLTGSAGSALWEDGAAAFTDEIGPLVDRARSMGVRLAIEPSNPLRTDISFVHTVRDAVTLARMSGVGVALDFYSCWYERDLDRTVRDNMDVIEFVQICDYALGTFDMPNRLPVGDGDIPVERLFRMVLDAGYEGAFDLEILGPRIEEEGYPGAIRRSLEHASEILDRLGA